MTEIPMTADYAISRFALLPGINDLKGKVCDPKVIEEGSNSVLCEQLTSVQRQLSQEILFLQGDAASPIVEGSVFEPHHTEAL